MTLIGIVVNSALLVYSLFIWLPIQVARYKNNMMQFSAVHKGTVMQRRYKALKKLTRGRIENMCFFFAIIGGSYIVGRAFDVCL